VWSASPSPICEPRRKHACRTSGNIIVTSINDKPIHIEDLVEGGEVPEHAEGREGVVTEGWK
jgi:hypothetical protein